MIHVRNLTKYYGDYPAVQDVSFDVPAGRIVGFLGPNGAGKSTTMRILTGYLTPNSGTASIDGHDVFWQPLEARRRIGYLPENCPLYPDMRVSEYLHFRAGIKGLHGRERSERSEYVMDRCWLRGVRRQLIGTLSKGFRQRVGLADSLLADPPVLILDEPTAGLDPTQIRETRGLIRELGQRHTILLSTHILPEVEMTCDSVIIINKGKVSEAGSLEDVAKHGRRLSGESRVLVVELQGDIDPLPVRAIPGVDKVEKEALADGTRLRISGGGDDVAARICALAVECGWKIRQLRHEQLTLEEQFIRIIARDEPAGAV